MTLAQSTIVDRIPFARESRKLPSVLSADEVVRFLEAVSSLKARVALTTAYAAGLRVSEVAAAHSSFCSIRMEPTMTPNSRVGDLT